LVERKTILKSNIRILDTKGKKKLRGSLGTYVTDLTYLESRKSGDEQDKLVCLQHNNSSHNMGKMTQEQDKTDQWGISGDKKITRQLKEKVVYRKEIQANTTTRRKKNNQKSKGVGDLAQAKRKPGKTQQFQTPMIQTKKCPRQRGIGRGDRKQNRNKEQGKKESQNRHPCTDQ